MRPGHHRPLGTTTWMRFTGWKTKRIPELGDVAYQSSGEGADDWDDVQRAYRVVGIEEGRVRSSFRLLMERVEYGTPPESADPDAIWGFFNLPRR